MSQEDKIKGKSKKDETNIAIKEQQIKDVAEVLGIPQAQLESEPIEDDSQ